MAKSDEQKKLYHFDNIVRTENEGAVVLKCSKVVSMTHKENFRKKLT